MYRKRLQTLILVAALTASAGSAGAPPAASTVAHPAVSAHTSALAGAAGAARIEACATAANQLLDHLIAGDAAATGNFSTTLQQALSAGDLDKFWQSLREHFGKPTARGRPQNLIHQGMVVINVPLHFTKGDLRTQFSCDKDGKFVGLHFLPIPATPAAGL